MPSQSPAFRLNPCDQQIRRRSRREIFQSSKLLLQAGMALCAVGYAPSWSLFTHITASDRAAAQSTISSTVQHQALAPDKLGAVHAEAAPRRFQHWPDVTQQVFPDAEQNSLASIPCDVIC